MFISSGELTPLSWGLIGIVLLFIIQLLLCLKAKRRAIKCIPVYIVVCGLLFGIATSIGLFGSYSAGAISGNGIVGFFIASIVGIAGVGIFVAWLVYWILRSVMRKPPATPKEDL